MLPNRQLCGMEMVLPLNRLNVEIVLMELDRGRFVLGTFFSGPRFLQQGLSF